MSIGSSIEKSLIGWAHALGILAVICLIYACYHGIDSLGYISHTRETRLYASVATWLIGESKICSVIPVPIPDPKYKKTDPAALLDCVNDGIGRESSGQIHTIEIKFWGLMERNADTSLIHWKCIREKKSFTCYDLD